MRMISHNNPEYRIKILDFAYTSQPLINNALPLKYSRLRFILFITACILTLGFMWLIARWSAKRKAILLYSVCNINEATHFLIQEEDDVLASIVERVNRHDFKRRQSVISFSYHDRNFLYHEQKDVFLPIRYEDLGMQLDRLKKGKFQAYSRRSRKKLLEYYGVNEILLNVQNSFQVFIQQMLTPYQVFQLYAIILWLSEEYYLFPIILLIYSIYTYWKTSKQIIKNQRKLAQKSYFNSACKVITKQKSGKSIEVQPANDSQDYTIVEDIHIDQMLSNRNNGNEQMAEQIEHKNSGFFSSNCSQKQEVQLDLENNKQAIQVSTIQSKQILPGDIIILKQGETVPCDCVLIYGQAIVDQSFISGINYLIRKTQIHSYQYSKNLEKTFLLYLGTKIVKAKRTKDWTDSEQKQDLPFANHSGLLLKDLVQANQIACLVTQTNYNTQRGKYLRQIRYQKKPSDNFTRESIYFIYIILVITTVVFLILIPFIRQHQSGGEMLYLFIDLIATSIPITLPTALSVGINFAQRRLIKHGIHSTLPSNILSGGRANTIVLDSSKVLSKNYQVTSIVVGVKNKSIGNTYSDLSQFLDMSNNETLSESFIQDPQRKKIQKRSNNQCGRMLIKAFSTCHSLQRYNNQLSGSAQQRHLYQFSKSKFLEDDQHECLGYNLKVKQRIYFKEKHKKIAVVVQIDQNPKKFSFQAQSLEMKQQILKKQIVEQNMLEKQKINAQKVIFIKGPAENIMKICLQGTYPANYHQYVVDLAEKGFKTVCFAYKKVPQNYNSGKNIDLLNQNFIFCGFALLQAQKQKDMIDTISQLKKSKMQILLISEQSQLVTSSLAINNGLCNKNQLIQCRMHHGKITCSGHIQWESQGSGQDLREFIMESDSLIRNSYLSLNSKLYQQLFMKKDDNSSENIFKKAIVFNEMQNRHSRNIYLQLQKRDRVTFAVGSGANVSECASLSMQLERGQCSMLSSFHTNQGSMKCITDCLIICRAALATNFHCFSMMILFSMVQFSTVSILYFYYQSLSDFQMVYEDLIVTFPIFVTINMTSPASKLSKELPPQSFFAPKALASMVGQFLIQLLTQIFFIKYVASLQFIKPEMVEAQEQFKLNQEFSSTNLTLAAFILTNYLYLGIVLSTSVSKPFRKPFYTNIFYTLTLVLLWLYNTAIVLFPEVVPQKLRRDNLSEEVQQILVLAMLLGNLIMIIMYLYQNCIIWFANFLSKIKAQKPNLSQMQLLDMK